MANDGTDELNQLSRDLALLPTAVRTEARAAMAKAGADIQALAQNLAPVDTGNLKSSITRDQNETPELLRVEIGPTANYGRYVEEGTSRMRAQPYLRPAVDRIEPLLFKAFEALGGRVL